VRAEDVAHLVALSAAALEPRHGDPAHAVRLIDRAEALRIDPRECWRLTLLRAYAAFRAGDPSAAGLAARAFEQVAAIDQPMLPLLKESELSEQLLGLAVETGQPAALALQASSSPRHLTLLGAFEITVARRVSPPPRGQGVQLLKVVALHRRIPVELVIASLWSEADLETGCNRLRTVLNRLRTDTGDLVEREGEVLVLARDVTVDLEQFDVEVQRVLALRHDDAGLAASVARGAMARYHGELLPDDRYEGWTEVPRERARRGMVDLLALCADEAAARGDLDEVRRLVVRAIEVDPYDDQLYVRAAAVLLDHGRRGEALSVLRRARVALGELGLDVPASLASLEARVRKGGDRR
jgi:DNA-binding SARP family transcriptional activator